MKKILIATILCLSLLASFRTVFGVYEISDGSIKALYHLENTTDSSGNGFTLTNNSSTAFLSSTAKLGNAANFDGTNYLSVDSSFPTSSTNITFGGWVSIPDATSKGAFFRNGDFPGSYGYGFGVGNGSNYHTDGNSLTWLTDSVAWRNVGNSVGTGWHWFVVTRDSTTWTAYVDNVAFGATWTTNPLTDSMGIFNIGKGYTSGGDNNWVSNGTAIDEVFFATTVLSSSTLASLYNAGAGVEICTSVGCGNPPVATTVRKRVIAIFDD